MTNKDDAEGEVEELDETGEFDPDEVVTFVDEEGAEHHCIVLAVVEYEGKDYAMLGEAEQLDAEDGDDVEVYIFEYSLDEEGNEQFGFIEDEARYEAVQAFCATLMDQDDDEES